MRKVALVTGGASGIGLACAERLARDGCAVVIADVNEKLGADQPPGWKGHFVAADLSSLPRPRTSPRISARTPRA